MKKLIDLINSGWDVNFQNQVKRIDSDFVIRTCWKAEYENERYECAWQDLMTQNYVLKILLNMQTK